MAAIDDFSKSAGCPACWPDEAKAAADALGSLNIEHAFVDESHFTIKLRSCRKCSQRFVSVFTETIDWADGDDPQFWSLVPITPAQAEELLADEESYAKVWAMTAGTRSLCHDCPKGAPTRSYWTVGLVVGPHD